MCVCLCVCVCVCVCVYNYISNKISDVLLWIPTYGRAKIRTESTALRVSVYRLCDH